MKVSCLTAAVIGVACLAAASGALIREPPTDQQPEEAGVEAAKRGAGQRVLAKDDTMVHNIKLVDVRKLPGDGKGKKSTKKPTKKTGTKKPTKTPTKKRTKKPTKKPRPSPDAAKNQFDLGPQFKKIEKFRCPGNNYISEISGTANKVLNSVTSFKCMPSKKRVKVSVGAPKKGTKYTVKSASGFRSFKGGYSANGEYASSITFYKDRLFDMEAKPTLGSQLKDGTALSPWLCDQGTRLTGLRLKGNTGGVVGFGTICNDVTSK